MHRACVTALIATFSVTPEASWASGTNAFCPTTAHQQLVEARYALETGDDLKAFKIWNELAQKGDAEGQLRLGQAFASGVAVERNESEFVKWVSFSASQNCAYSMYLLGVHFFFKEPKKSFYWHLKAASIGDKHSQFHVGLAYYYGNGVEENHKLAKVWFEKSALQGVPISQFEMGKMWENGDGGLIRDMNAAVHWYKLSANGGYAEAQFVLGQLYSSGRGVPLNLIEAYKWFNLSAASDQAEVSNKAKIQRDLLEFKMSDAELSEGRKASLQFDSAHKY